MKPLREAVRPTTIIKPEKLRRLLGADLVIASETFQHTGSFKFRAAYNVVLNVPNEEMIGVSSGNFGQALAYACSLAGRKCTIVMPHNSASVKVEAVRSYGAEVDLINVNEVSRAERVKQLSEERPDAYLASAYDDQFVIDGNSTLGDELVEMGVDADVFVIPVGGGGLIAGTIDSFKRNGCKASIVGAEPAMANDAARSFAAGELIANAAEPQTIADGARTLSLGKLNWPIIRDGAAKMIEVSEAKIAEALRHYYAEANLKVEPTGALSLGALLEHPDVFAGKKVCLIVSGGNVDTAVYADLITG